MAAKTRKRRCSGTTRQGKPCRAHPIEGKDTCLAHSDAETRESVGFIANNGMGGRPRRPRVVDVYREKVEREADEWFKVLTDARGATHAVVTWDGERNQITYVDDHRTRLRAFREAMDRVFGRPMQFVDATVRADESEIDREISELLAEMNARDPELAEVAAANGRSR